jgi:S-adenosylmethionine:tRNA ribosyltransferase-isomerase
MMSRVSELLTADFDYVLPPDLIAQEPLEDRLAARMMVVDRVAGTLRHSHVRDLPRFLRADDLLVLNDTRVIPARIQGHKAGTGGQVELLLLEEGADGTWEALCGASRRPRVGGRLLFADGRLQAEVLAWGPGGRVTVRFQAGKPLLEVLDEVGIPPLPPYIKRPAAPPAATLERDREFYQTVYARVPGAVAAPTAGLHLTEALLDQLGRQGVSRAFVTLHVGMGTFKPVLAESVRDHRMEEERFAVGPETVGAVDRARRAGGRVVAVGSTVVRTLETLAAPGRGVRAGSGRTGIFIHPPHEFQVVDAMLTNFHLPRSTLLMMVCALAGAPLVREAYAEAIRERYRFYSYGDCMLIV